MKKFMAVLAFGVVACSTTLVRAEVLTSIPGPDDQGGMIMPMVQITGNTLSVMFMPPNPLPTLGNLNYWSFGDTFQPSAAWYGQLDPVGGQGKLFNNQYGFTAMGIPVGKALGIRLLTESSSDLQYWNYVNNQNRFDEVFTGSSPQVLWNGNMWHNYVTLPDNATPGIYTATFEVFLADTAFTTGTGYADYTSGALAAEADPAYNTVTITYSWEVIPEPSTYVLLALGAVAFLAHRRWTQRTA